MEMNNLTEQELNTLLNGAVLVRESRSGTTQNWRLNNDKLVSLYYCKSGRVVADYIDSEDSSLTVRY